ncbi:MAG: hypothetical protein AB1422_14740 [bacterium]
MNADLQDLNFYYPDNLGLSASHKEDLKCTECGGNMRIVEIVCKEEDIEGILKTMPGAKRWFYNGSCHSLQDLLQSFKEGVEKVLAPNKGLKLISNYSLTISHLLSPKNFLIFFYLIER